MKIAKCRKCDRTLMWEEAEAEGWKLDGNFDEQIYGFWGTCPDCMVVSVKNPLNEEPVWKHDEKNVQAAIGLNVKMFEEHIRGYKEALDNVDNKCAVSCAVQAAYDSMTKLELAYMYVQEKHKQYDMERILGKLFK